MKSKFAKIKLTPESSIDDLTAVAASVKSSVELAAQKEDDYVEIVS